MWSRPAWGRGPTGAPPPVYRKAGSGSDEELAVLDLDLRNTFPSLEWDSIEESVAEHTPSLGAWTRWCHAEPAQVQSII